MHTRSVAIVHLAMFEAVNSIDRRYGEIGAAMGRKIGEHTVKNSLEPVR